MPRFIVKETLKDQDQLHKRVFNFTYGYYEPKNDCVMWIPSDRNYPNDAPKEISSHHLCRIGALV